ncbi:MAG: GDP-mannose 4,6-dehydratase, partial [Nitrospirota bacterium]|nr:GDP-mannose 4,6-dehydratase [Nitrospirota bacterium]
MFRDINSSFFSGRKIFITGHTGFKGSWLCLYLSLLGAKVTGYALDPPTNPNLFELCRIDELVTSIIADVREGKSLTAAINTAQPEIVIHMAAQPLVRESYKVPA